jgi:hypothetical protein
MLNNVGANEAAAAAAAAAAPAKDPPAACYVAMPVEGLRKQLPLAAGRILLTDWTS